MSSTAGGTGRSGVVVTFDLFSALTDSARGGAAALGALAERRGWAVTGGEVYAAWDAANKAAQRDARPPTTFAELSARALAEAYDGLGLDHSLAAADMGVVHAGVGDWPLWPDVADAVAAVAALPGVVATGLLSNVDDALARRTRAAGLVDPDRLLTSQRLGAYKPDPVIYRAAVDAAAPHRLVHVAASARDVRGALEAGITAVRLARPGHHVDPDGPRPPHEVTDAADLPALVAGLVERLVPGA